MSDFWPFTDEDKAVIRELAQKQDLPYIAVLRQALRLYQAVALGDVKVVTEPPVGCPNLDDDAAFRAESRGD